MADPLHQFVIEPYVPIKFGALDLSFTNASLWMVIAAALSLAIFMMGTRRKSVIPGRLQLFCEMIHEFVAEMIRDNMGPKGREFFPFVFTVFIIVLMGNILGLIPYSFTYTSHIAVTGALALMIFLLVTILGIVRHGTAFFSLFMPPGVPIYIAPLIIPIEIISYLSRPVTLSLRLFINMFAGHLMLKVIAGFSVAMFGLGFSGALGALAPMAFNVLMIGFELFVALIQAYVFALLTCIYLNDTIEIHH